MNFLGGHRLRLDDGPRFFLADDLQDDFARLRRRARPNNFCSARFELCGEFVEISVEMIDRFPFRFGGELARGIPSFETRPCACRGRSRICSSAVRMILRWRKSRVMRLRLSEIVNKSHAKKILPRMNTDEHE